MGVVNVRVFKSPAFRPGDADVQRITFQAEMNTFLAAVLPQDVLQLQIDYSPDSKYAGHYTWVGHITYYVP